MDDSQFMDTAVSCDPVREFLLCKLAEIEEENKKLEKQIEKRAEVFRTSLHESTKKSNVDSSLTIEDCWQKVHNGHWIVGIYVRNNPTST